MTTCLARVIIIIIIIIIIVSDDWVGSYPIDKAEWSHLHHYFEISYSFFVSQAAIEAALVYVIM